LTKSLRWSLNRKAWIIEDLKKYGTARVVDKLYARGAGFRFYPELKQALQESDATQRVLDEINRNVRSPVMAPRKR